MQGGSGGSNAGDANCGYGSVLPNKLPVDMPVQKPPVQGQLLRTC